MEVATASGTNGAVPASKREQIALQLEELIDESRERETVLRAELTEVSGEIKSYEQALTRLRGQSSTPSPKPRKRAATSADQTPGTSVGPERLAKLDAAVRQFARDHEEFRQIDFRSSPLSEGMSSSVSSTVFEVLRQKNVLRLARRDGNHKYYRLTAEALSEQ
jgi:DNA-binding transcriptional ArsR family regulator